MRQVKRERTCEFPGRSHGKLYSMFCPQTFHVRETSPGKNKIFLSMCLPHLLQAIPGSIGTSTCRAALSLLTALYVVSVRQTGDLPTPSFRFCLTADTLGVQLYPSHYRAGSGLSPVRFCPCRAHTPKAGLPPIETAPLLWVKANPLLEKRTKNSFLNNSLQNH